jgi:hypothetical protein
MVTGLNLGLKTINLRNKLRTIMAQKKNA